MEFQYKEIVNFLGSLLAKNFTNARFKFNSSMFTTDKFFTLLTLIRCFISATNTLTLRSLCTSSCCLIMNINFHFSFYIWPTYGSWFTSVVSGHLIQHINPYFRFIVILNSLKKFFIMQFIDFYICMHGTQ